MGAMMANEKINPDSVILNQLEGQWEKVCMVLLHKLSSGKTVKITAQDFIDVRRHYEPDGPVLFTHGMHDSFELSVITHERAKELAAYEASKQVQTKQ
jgi:hypothetical protein